MHTSACAFLLLHPTTWACAPVWRNGSAGARQAHLATQAWHSTPRSCPINDDVKYRCTPFQMQPNRELRRLGTPRGNSDAGHTRQGSGRATHVYTHTAEAASTIISNRLSVRSPSQTDTPHSTPTCPSCQPPVMLFPICLHTCLLLLLHRQHLSSETRHEPSPCAPNRQRPKCLALQQCCQALLTPQALHHHPLIIHCAALSSIIICLKCVSARARLLASSCSFVLTRASRPCCSSDSLLLCRATPRSWAACRACGVGPSTGGRAQEGQQPEGIRDTREVG